MFGWLAKMLMQTPVQNSCTCCEGKRERLEEMRQQIVKGEINAKNQQSTDDVIICCDTPEHEYAGKILGYMVSGPYTIQNDRQVVGGEKDCKQNRED